MPRFVLRLVDAPVVDDLHVPADRAVRQRRPEREAHHLLRRVLGVVAGLGAVGDAATTPLRRADRAVPGAAGSLLAPRLRTAAGDLGTGLRAVRAGALDARAARVTTWCSTAMFGMMPNSSSGSVTRCRPSRRSGTPRRPSCADLRLYGVARCVAGDPTAAVARSASASPAACRHRRRRVVGDGRFLLARGSYGPTSGPSPRCARTRGCRSLRAPSPSRAAARAPGRPRRPRGSASSIFFDPCWPGHAHALEDACRRRARADRAGARCFLWFPWLAPWPLKLWRCITPVKPLPLLMPVTSTRSPASNTSAAMTCPTS